MVLERGGVHVKSKILIAYQDDSWVKELSSLLGDVGYRIETTKVVSEIIRKVRGRDTYVVLLDDKMEEIKAFDLVPLFKKINSRVQIIVISSEESIGGVKRLRDAGIFYQAMKPVDLEEIRSAVACAFEKIEREQPREVFIPFLIPERVPA
jgi:DNA-binding NtrC family response regulator